MKSCPKHLNIMVLALPTLTLKATLMHSKDKLWLNVCMNTDKLRYFISIPLLAHLSQ